MSKSPSHRWLWVIVAALAASNALLIWQNIQMRREVERYQPRRLKPGDTVSPFKAAGLDGSPVEVSFEAGARGKVLLFFSPSCPYCGEQFAHWRELMGRIDASRFEVVGLVNEKEDRGKVREYLEKMGCAPGAPTPLRVAFIPAAVRNEYLLDSTPTTLVLNGEGTVEQNLIGRWTEAEAKAAGATLGFARLTR
ncbi:MAG: TlpA disulfide reductase family protein [Pyrinomonadaceae bacterium]